MSALPVQAPDVVARRVELAMQMHDLGAWIFPLAPGSKLPLLAKRHGGHGFLDAKPDRDMTRTFLSNPSQPNYGVVFPEGSDVIILDLDGGGDDPRPTWQADWQRLYNRLGPPGLTYIVRTPSGGRHAYYHWRTDLYGAWPPGDEMLGWTVRKPWTGYAVGPGSVVKGLTYEPVGLPTIADLPESWARAALAEKPGRDTQPTGREFITIKGPAQVQKGGRHRYLRDRARYLVGIGLTGEALYAAIADLNRQLPEPKTEEEIRRAIGEVESKFEPDELDPETGQVLAATARGPLAASNRGLPRVLDLPFYPAVTVAAMTQEQVDWAWTDYLAYGTIVEIVGPPKAGKTTLVLNLLRAYVERRPFLDRATAGGPVVVLTEQGPTSLRAVIARAGLAEREDVEFLLYRDARGREWRDIVETSIQRCRAIGARFLVVDTLPVFAGLSGETENNAGDALTAMEPLLGAAGEGLAVLVNRHRRKGGAPDIADEGRGSGAFSGTVDVILALRRKEGGGRPTVRVLAAASRFDETPEELFVELEDNHYVVLGDDAAVETAEAREAVLSLLAAAVQVDGGKQEWTVADLVEITGKARGTLQRVLNDLLRTEDLVRVGESRGNRAARYALPDPGSVSHQTPAPYGGAASGGLDGSQT
ncbi:MAG: AAA family ATPase, partial [Candidatus Shapirobacteria bacterium]